MSTMETTTPGATKAEAAKGAATEVVGQTTTAAADLKDTAKTEVQSVVSDAKDRAGEVLRTTHSELRSQVEDKTKSLASSLDTVAQQLSSMAEKADEPDSPVVQLSRTAAEQIRRQSERIEEGGLEGLLEDTRRFARNRPGAFFLGTVVAGFAAGRLAKHADLKQAVTAAKEELTGGEPGGGDSTTTSPTSGSTTGSMSGSMSGSMTGSTTGSTGSTPGTMAAPPVVVEPALGPAADGGGLQ